MTYQRKTKSLILQEVVSENPEKILFGRKGKSRLKMGEDLSCFLKDLMQNRGEAKHLILELGAKRNSPKNKKNRFADAK